MQFTVRIQEIFWVYFFCSFCMITSADADLYNCRIGISHIEGGGIGYCSGYTTLDFFVMGSTTQTQNLYPFLDIRGHGLDRLKLAANIGVGLRYLTNSNWILGTNVYYDNRQGSHLFFNRVGYTYQQVALGFEALSPCLDFRLNLYQPFGSKVREFTQVAFHDHLGITPILTRKLQSTMKGLDGEVGTCLIKGELYCHVNWNFYGAVGGYYLDAAKGRNRLGGKARLSTMIGRYFFCELQGYYDKISHGLVQVRAGIQFPLYPFASEIERTCHDRERGWGCWGTLREMISQPVVRAEIMPLYSHHIN